MGSTGASPMSSHTKTSRAGMASGGGSTGRTWLQIQADIYGVPLKKSTIKKKSAVGAAMLAGVGIGAYADLEEAVSLVPRYDTTIEPFPKVAERYQGIYQHYRELYPRLREDFRRLSQP